MRGAQQARLVRLLDWHFRHHTSAEEDDGPVAGESDLGQFGGEQEHRRARGGKLAHERIDLPLGADVDATGRIEAQQSIEAGRKPARDDDLLLVAAAQAPKFGSGAGVDLQAVDRGLAPASVPRARRPRPI